MSIYMRNKTDIDSTIPITWNVKKLRDIFVFKNGLNKEKQYFGTGIPIVNYVDVYSSRAIEGVDLCGKVDVNKSEIERYSVKSGDVFFTRTSETINEIGFASVITKVDKPTVFSGFILRARETEKILDDLFKKYCFSTYKVRKEIITKSSMTTRALTSGKLLGEVEITIPTLSEQKKIGAILFLWDRDIQNKKVLIGLLKSKYKTYLSRIYTIDDVVNNRIKVQLGNISEIKKGKQLNKNSMIINSDYPVVNGGIKISGHFNNFNTTADTITISEGGNSCGFVNFIEKDFWAGGHCYIIKPKNDKDIKIDNRYLFHYLKFSERKIQRLRVGSGLPNIQKNEIVKFPLSIHKFKKQEEISKFLDTVSNSIKLTEEEMELIIMQKQGLMQRLLTGEIRVQH